MLRGIVDERRGQNGGYALLRSASPVPVRGISESLVTAAITALCGVRRRVLVSSLLRDSGGHVRARLELPGEVLDLDLVHEALPDLAQPDDVESVLVESERDMHASKLTCLLSRSEPRDLVDVMFLERAVHRPEDGLADALRKDAGIDPGVLAWLLTSFPVEPLPVMLVPLSVGELTGYRDALAARLKALSLGTSAPSG